MLGVIPRKVCCQILAQWGMAAQDSSGVLWEIHKACQESGGAC